MLYEISILKVFEEERKTLEAWIKSHRHKTSSGKVMHSRMCLIFKVVVVFVSLSIFVSLIMRS